MRNDFAFDRRPAVIRLIQEVNPKAGRSRLLFYLHFGIDI
ncbi:hypothetical protein X742_19690 [Mesorhizobium sp. LNHC232B00]|nr:hypothetical protein X742_19690 [Mesorhizobium sp. LNHC232B00]